MAKPQTLAVEDIRKSFGSVEVLHGVSFELRGGEVHALVGENGAGKSTLIKIIAGAYDDYSGTLRRNGVAVRFRTPRDAERHGIAAIFQELSLIPDLSVADNVFLGAEPRRWWGGIHRPRVAAALEAIMDKELGLAIDSARPVRVLPLAWQQATEIAKALARNATFVIMDEPTSALTDTETRQLFKVIHRLKKRGVGIIYISHKLDEIFQIADRVSVLRDGALVKSAPTKEWSTDQIISAMVGQKLTEVFPERAPRSGQRLLQVRDLTIAATDQPRPLVSEASFEVQSGEIVGIAGLAGSGASALLEGVFGARPVQRGSVRIREKELLPTRPAKSLAHGVALLTNDRQARGLIQPMSALHNVSLSILKQCTRLGLLNREREWLQTRPFIDRMHVTAPSLEAPVTTLSGGNQQKVLLARWLATQPRALLLDDPTRGVDVGAKREIYLLLQQLTAMGLGMVLTSSELPELLGLADRVLVMHRGRVTKAFARADCSQEAVLKAAMGG